ncbi:hypothetical protein ACINWC743_1581 [Acinetobacter sp. WC-743]|uniref:hypothetical protein n=1 Tax=Acinetobacter sp. WC-743 TaxID=903945 RepID=UPI0002AEA536|nr:hypothetical protein [Acinetobacter sp. WC-743]ELW82026.1 hypothetical protein ACINWC743_1581 [Acinetobacter sp. WC-743]
MSDILSRVQILLDANTARFEQNMRNAQSTSTTTFTKIADGAKKMAGVVATAAVTGATALVAYGNEHIKVIDELEKYAYLSDATFENFQRQAIGASALGFETEKLADMYKDFNEKLGEFNTNGGGGAKDFFEQVALKTEGSSKAALKLMKDLADLSGPEGLELYVKKMQEANLSNEQMSFLSESMASDLTGLLPLLVNNAEGMHLWADAGERAGVIINDETREAAKALKVEIKLLDMQMEGAKNQVMQALLPAMVDITSAFLTSEGGTISLTGATETLATGLKWLAKVGLGVVAVFDIVGTTLGGTAAAMASSDVRAEDVIQDLEKKIAGYGDKFDRINGEGGVTDSQKKRLIEIEQERAKLAGSTAKNYQAQTQGMKDFADKQDEAAKKAGKHEKAQKGVNKTYEDAKKLLYDYGTEFQRIDYDLKNESTLIYGAALKSDAKARMIAEAKEISDARKRVYLLEYEKDLDSWSWNEDQKLQKTFDMEKAKVNAIKGMSKDEKKLRNDSLGEAHEHEMAWLKLEQAQRLNNAQEAFQTEMQKITSKYEFEREQIRLNMSLSGEDKNALIGASERTQDLENDERRRRAWNDFQDASGIDTSADDAQSNRNEAFKQAFEWQLITQEEYQSLLLESEIKYHKAKAEIGLASASSTMSNLTELSGSMLGEQSSAYKAMFAMSKAFAVAKALMSVNETYLETYKSVSMIPLVGPYIAPAMAAGAVAVQLVHAAQIKDVQLGGIFHGGYDYVPEEATYLLDEGERVLSPRQNSDFTEFLQRENDGQTGYNLTVNVQTLPGTTAEVSMQDGQLNVQMIRKEIDEYLPSQMSRANSPISQAFSTYYAVPRVR